MKRRDFIRTAPLAIAGAATLSPQIGADEPFPSQSVIRVETTPAGPLPVMEMMGNFLVNHNVFFDEVKWKKVRNTSPWHLANKLMYHSVKDSKGFLKKENAILCPNPPDHKSVWLACGAVNLRLKRECVGVTKKGKKQYVDFLHIHPSPESMLIRVAKNSVDVVRTCYQ